MNVSDIRSARFIQTSELPDDLASAIFEDLDTLRAPSGVIEDGDTIIGLAGTSRTRSRSSTCRSYKPGLASVSPTPSR